MSDRANPPARQLGSVSLRYRLPMPWRTASQRRQNFAPMKPAPSWELPEPAADARDEPLARLEAVLLLSREPASTRRLAQLAGLADGTEARTFIRRLNRLYD